MDYSKTLKLPQTDFSMRANLPQREPELLKQQKEKQIYKKLLEHNCDKELFILHDGPPFANGDIHIGHALNKILKDIVVKNKAMTGFKTPFVPGWDTHGLPIEQQAIKKLGVDRFAAGEVKFRQICKEFAEKYINNQITQFERLGVIGEYDNPYITYTHEFEAKQIEVFGEMAKKGYMYRGLKPVYWCADCVTALAEAEIEYADETSNSIYVKFKVSDDLGKISKIVGNVKDVYFVIWTTTTWTLPGNVAISLNPDYMYSFVKVSNEVLVIAKDLVEGFCKECGIENFEIIGECEGIELELIKCQHPFLDRESLVIVGDHVTLDAGTGCVHTAPGHGVEDYIVCKNYPQLPIIVPVDEKGVLTQEAGEFSGMYYKKSNKAIIEKLTELNALVKVSPINHSYPHCWRCKEPIIFRATEQWFASVEAFKDKAIEEALKVNWVPKWGKDRIVGMIQSRGDWCISRQRIWGVPIPIFYCDDCKEPLINDETISIIKNLFLEKGSNAWYELDAKDILPSSIKCKCGCGSFTKEHDIMDVWFDSGSSHSSVLETRDNLSYPADMYLEGNDQYRGWFQSSLLTAVATKGTAPYKTVLTHGMVVDGEGKKMSKSIGNGVDPIKVTEKYGSDILRLWVISVDYQTDVRMSEDILKQLSETYRKIRNTARYILGNISDFDPNKDIVAFSDMQELDKWAIIKLNELVKIVRDAYDSYDYHIVYHNIHNFCVVSMSNFYLDVIKDRLYAQKGDSHLRKSAQSAMYMILRSLNLLLAPVLSFTTEEIWQAIPKNNSDNYESVLLNDMPSFDEKLTDSAILEKYNFLLDLRSDVAKALELKRADKTIGLSLAAKVSIYANDEMYEKLSPIANELKEIFIVSDIEISKEKAPEGIYVGEVFSELSIGVTVAEGEKCERCWIVSKTVGQNAEHSTICDRCVTVIE